MSSTPADKLAAAPPASRIDISRIRDYGIVASFVILFVILTLSTSNFLTKDNLLNILDQWAPVGIIACGSTMVMIARGFDLSVGAVYAVAGVIAAKLAGSMGVAPALVLGCLSGLALGLGNGLVVTRGRINPFIGTLASTYIVRGLALAITGGALLTVASPTFNDLGRNELFGIKYSIIIFAVVALVLGFILHRTTFGRYVYAVGGGPDAARLSGVRVDLIRTATYMISGLGAGIGGVLAASRVSSGQADAGMGLEFEVIAAVVIGGTSILGGEGAMWRTIIGVFTLAIINNGFNLLNVEATYQQMVFGAIILLAVGLDAWSRKRSA